jgi:hypothetical protein
MLVSEKVAEVATPETEAVTLYAPAVPFATAVTGASP